MKSFIKPLLITLSVAAVAGVGFYFSRTMLVSPAKIEKIQNVSFTAKALTKQESKGLLGKDVISAGYQPIQITLENKGNDYLKYSPEDISLKTVPAQVVAESVFSNTTGKAVGWGIAGLFLPVLWIPGIVVSARSYEANQKLAKDFKEKSYVHRVVEPNAQMKDLIFVNLKDYNDNFTVTLTNISSQEKVLCKADLANQQFIVS